MIETTMRRSAQSQEGRGGYGEKRAEAVGRGPAVRPPAPPLKPPSSSRDMKTTRLTLAAPLVVGVGVALLRRLVVGRRRVEAERLAQHLEAYELGCVVCFVVAF